MRVRASEIRRRSGCRCHRTSGSAVARCVGMPHPPCRQRLLVFFEFFRVHGEHAVVATAVAAVAGQGFLGGKWAWVGGAHAIDERISMTARSRDAGWQKPNGRVHARMLVRQHIHRPASGWACLLQARPGAQRRPLLAATIVGGRSECPAANHSAVMLACRLYLRSFSTRVVRRMPSSLAACATTPLDAASACRIKPTSMSAR